jgi:hypothetical protein
MTPWLWLLATAVAAVAAYLVGWPAWQQYRTREARDLNVDRYNAWRGRAGPRHERPREGMTGEERRRIYAGIGLGVVAIFCLVGFFTYA